jgi:hypothetical protein
LVKQNTPGMLIKYKKSKALDEFGREGKGEVVSSRIAIFRTIYQDSSGHAIAKIETFNSNYFYTKEHWMVEHDGEVPSSLHSEVIEAEMTEIGLGDLFLGSKYHFILPIQQDESESQVVIESIDEDGRNIKKKCTIPERMKLVFDSWGIEYNEESLNKSIEETKKSLEDKKNHPKSHIESICEDM